MGTWGPGNFDSDTAADHLSMLASKLVTDIETAMSGDPVGLEPDEWDGTTVPCNVELLTLIARQRWVGVTLPAPDAVAEWAKTFVGVWEATIDDLDPSPEWRVKRRAVLVKTFADLEELCAKEAASQAVPAPAGKPKSAAKAAKAAASKAVKPAATKAIATNVAGSKAAAAKTAAKVPAKGVKSTSPAKAKAKSKR